MGTKAASTPERRAKQANIIRLTKPWTMSTGPKSEAGKTVSSRNAYAGAWLHDQRERRASIMAAALVVFNRERMPRWPKTDTGRTRN